CLVDDHDRGRFRTILPSEVSTGDQSGGHGFEITGHHRVEIDRNELAICRSFFEANAGAPGTSADRYVDRQARRLHTGRSFDSFNYLLIKNLPLRLGVVLPSNVDVSGQYMFRVEAKVYGTSVLHCSQEESCANH